MGPKEMDHNTPTKDEVQPSTQVHKGEHNPLPSCSVYSKPDAGQIFLLWVWQVSPEVLSVKKVLRGSVGDVPHFCSFLGTLFRSRLYFLRLPLL